MFILKLSEIEDSVFEECDKYKPEEYIELLKARKGSYVTDEELDMILYVKRVANYSDAVINFSLFYMYEVRNNEFVKDRFFHAIMNDWGRNKLDTPQKVVSYLKKRLKEKTTGRRN